MYFVLKFNKLIYHMGGKQSYLIKSILFYLYKFKYIKQ